MNMYAAAMNLNAVDVVMAVVMAAIICTGRRGGIVSELVKLFGIFCTIFITLHYYVHFADFLRVQFLGKDASTEFFAFCVLAISVFAIFILVTRGWVLIVRIKLKAAVDRWGGTILALIRSHFTCGLIFVALFLSGHNYATPKAQQSVSRLIFRNAATDLYKLSYVTFIQGFFPGEKMNEDVFKLVAEESGKNRRK